MEFEGVESLIVELLSTPEMQRLRRVRQLGLAYLVFPGAEHTRLVHSLGAAHLALRMAKQLRQSGRGTFANEVLPDDWSIRDIGLAALLHDLGHGPLSHSWERELLGHDFDRDEWVSAMGLEEWSARLSKAKWHEIVGLGLLRWEEGFVHKLLESRERGFADRIASLLSGSYFLDYLPQLLSSDVDVDRADYILRDAYQTGVAYGRYDIDWLVSMCSLGLSHGRLVIGFDKRKGTRVVEQFLVARRALHDTVYFHRTVRAAEAMIGLFLGRFRDSNAAEQVDGLEGFVKPLAKILGGQVLGHREILDLDDFSMWVLLKEVSEGSKFDPVLRELASRILCRELLKEVPVEGKKLRTFMMRPDANEQLEKAVSKHVSGEPKYFFHLDTVEFEMFVDEPGCGYLVDNGEAKQMRFASSLLPIDKSFTRDRLFTVREALHDVRKLIDP